jgi:hypothetical protein
MCKPWVDGSTYGLELVYPFDTECRVRAVNGECEFVGDFAAEKAAQPDRFSQWDVPFSSFAPNHFGFTSSVDLKTADGFGTMILPHPRFYADRTGTVPCPVMGFLESDWWPRIFFVVFKAPLDGQEYVFRKGEPYATLLVLPKTPRYAIRKMTPAEELARIEQDNALRNNSRAIATRRFVDDRGQPFDNKYKVLAGIARREGVAAATQAMACPRQRSRPTIGRRMIWEISPRPLNKGTP